MLLILIHLYLRRVNMTLINGSSVDYWNSSEASKDVYACAPVGDGNCRCDSVCSCESACGCDSKSS